MEGDLEIRGGGGRGQCKEKFFWPFGPHFCLQIRGWLGPSPGSATDNAFLYNL